MPASYVHYRFGREVLTCLPKHYREIINKHRELFDIGLHGPDILFYYKPLSSNRINKLGNAMHDESSAPFFLRMAELVREFPRAEALTAYLYGFICHFTLDSACHPYIEKMTTVGGFSHTELETELERYFMLRDHLDPAVYIPIQHIHATDVNCRVIAPCFGLDSREIKASLKGMINCHKLLNAPSSCKRKLLYAGLKVTKNFDSMQGLILKPKPAIDCKKYCHELAQLFTDSITVAASLIQQYQNVISYHAGLPIRFSETFGAGEHWNDLYID